MITWNLQQCEPFDSNRLYTCIWQEPKNDPLYFTMYALVCPNIGMKFICDIGHIWS